MALQCSGTISLDDVRDEISDPDDIGLGHANSRLLAGIPVGEIKMSDFYCTQDIPDWIEFGGTIPPLNGTEPANYTLYANTVNNDATDPTLTPNQAKVLPLFDNSESTYTQLPWDHNTTGGHSAGSDNGPREIFARYIDPMGQGITLNEYSFKALFSDYDYWGNGPTIVRIRYYAIPVSGPTSSLLFHTFSSDFLSYGYLGGIGPTNASVPGFTVNAIATTNGLVGFMDTPHPSNPNIDWFGMNPNTITPPDTNILNSPFYLVCEAQLSGVYGAYDSMNDIRLYGSTYTVTAH